MEQHNVPTSAEASTVPDSSDDEQLFERIRQGDAEASEGLFREVYAELHRLARRRMAEQADGHTLQPTALINEAYLRLDRGRHRIRDRKHFLCLAARIMRQILVEHARRAQAAKRPDPRDRVDAEGLLDQLGGQLDARAESLTALDCALERLEAVDPDLALLVELHFFGGQSMDECALTLGISQRQAFRWWKSARAFLYRELREDGFGGPTDGA